MKLTTLRISALEKIYTRNHHGNSIQKRVLRDLERSRLIERSLRGYILTDEGLSALRGVRPGLFDESMVHVHFEPQPMVDNPRGELIHVDFQAKRVIDRARVTTESVRGKISRRFGGSETKLPREGVLDGNRIKTYIGNIHLRFNDRGFLKNWPMQAPCDIDWLKDQLVPGSHYVLEDECFQWLDTKYQLTQELLRALAFKDCTVTIRTRSDLVAHEVYFDLIKDLSAVEVTFLFPNHDCEIRYRKENPGAPSLKRLDKAADRLRAAGITANKNHAA